MIHALVIIGAVVFVLASLFFIWCLCRASGMASRWEEDQEQAERAKRLTNKLTIGLIAAMVLVLLRVVMVR